MFGTRVFSKFPRFDRSIWIRFIGEMVNSITFAMLMPFLAIYMNEKMETAWQVGVVMSLSPLAMIIGSFVGGRISDSIGRKPVKVLSMVGNGLFLFGYVIFDHFLAYCFISFGAGFFNSFFHPAASAMVADVTPDNQQTELFGFLRMGMKLELLLVLCLVSRSCFFLFHSCSYFSNSIWYYAGFPT